MKALLLYRNDLKNREDAKAADTFKMSGGHFGREVGKRSDPAPKAPRFSFKLAGGTKSGGCPTRRGVPTDASSEGVKAGRGVPTDASSEGVKTSRGVPTDASSEGVKASAETDSSGCFGIARFFNHFQYKRGNRLHLWIAFCLMAVSLSADNCGIPRKIWQTYRSRELPAQAREAQVSWLEMNPHYEYRFLDDAEIENYILNTWNLDVYNFFRAMPIGVMKADLWRYLIIADQGGVYSDIDSICCLPIDYWALLAGSLHKIEEGGPVLILGIENDDGRKVIDFCQWTFMATPKHPALEFACDYIVDNWRRHGIDTSRKEVVHLTAGPTILKQALMTYFGEPLETRASDFYFRYTADKELREKLARLGVYLLPKIFYNGLFSVHLVASMNFGGGYIRWSDEVNALRRKE